VRRHRVGMGLAYVARMMNMLLLLAAMTMPAHAVDERFITGTFAVVVPMGADTLNWALVPEREHALAWHLVPVVGPVVGLRANGRLPCDDPKHGCSMQRGMLYIVDFLSLASEIAGVTTLLVATADRNGQIGLEVDEQRTMLRFTGRW
jgi:hypothetical protein